MLIKILPKLVIKTQLQSFVACLLLLSCLIFAWDLVMALVHVAGITPKLLFALLLKAIARSEQALPFAVIIAAMQVQLNFAASGQYLAMKLFGYSFTKTVLPAVGCMIITALVYGFAINKAKPELMLRSNTYFCQAGAGHFCHAKTKLWGYQPGIIVYFQDVQAANASGVLVQLDPNSHVSQVKLQQRFIYKDGAWWANQQKLPIQLAPNQLQYSILETKDQPSAFLPSILLLLSFFLSGLFSLFAWGCLAEGSKLTTMIKYLGKE